MAQAPYTPYPTEEPSGVPARSHDLFEQRATPEAFGGGVAKALQGLGAQGERSSQQMGEALLERQQLHNQLWANDANTDYVNKATDLYSDFQNKRGADAVGAFEDYKKNLQNLYKSTIASAPNPKAALMLSDNARYYTDYYMRTGTAYMDQQRTAWTRQSLTDGANTAFNKAALAVMSPEDFATQIGMAQKQVRALAVYNGLDGDAEVARATGAAMTKIIGDVAETDPGRAHAILDAYKGQMDAAGQYSASRVLAPYLATETAKQKIDAIYAKPMAVPSAQAPVAPAQQSPSLAQAIETAGEHGKVGQVSPKGALGPMQVVPDATKKKIAADLGLPWDEERLKNDAGYNRQIGTAFLNMMLQRYGGNQTLAVAAYNAGPGAVDGWIRQFGDPRTGAITNEEFASKIPIKETNDYVGRVNAAFPDQNTAAPASGPLPTPPGMASIRAARLQQVIDAARDQPKPVQDAMFADFKRRNEIEDASYVDQERYHRLTEQHEKDVATARENEYRKQVFGPNPGSVTAQQVVNDPAFQSAAGRESGDRILSLISGNGSAAAKLSRATVVDLFNRMHLPADDPRHISDLTPIDKAFGENRLTREDHDWAVKRFTDGQSADGQKLSQREAQFVKAFEQKIDRTDPLGGHEDPDGPTRLYLFNWDIDQKVAQYRKAGKDPNDLFDPSKPDYMGKPEALKPYIATLDEAMKSVMAKYGVVPPGVETTRPPASGPITPLPPAPPAPRRPPPEPGESAEAYMKRLGL